jgi:hypothetical protein
MILPIGVFMSLESILCIPDTHIPFEDKRAVELMFKVARVLKPVHVVHLGDMVDFYALSFHEKDPARAQLLEQELEEGKAFLRRLKQLGARTNILCGSNHHDRIVRYMRTKAPELSNILNERKFLDLDAIGFKLVPYKQSHRIGKMRYTHDVGYAGKFSVQQTLAAVQHNVTIGHVHRIGYFIEGNTDGEKHIAMCPGWLGDAAAIDYMHTDKVARDWALGFAVGYLDTETKSVHQQIVPILPNYTCVFNGRLFSA